MAGSYQHILRNPKMTSGSTSGGLFGSGPGFGEDGLGTQLFGSQEGPLLDEDDEDSPPPPESESEEDEDLSGSDSESDSDAASDTSVFAAPSTVPTPSSPWHAAPAYEPAYYLSTSAEYVPPAPRIKVPSGTVDDDREAGVGKSRKAEERAGKEAKWEEGYEDSTEVDKVFEKFARVAGYEGEQCIR